MLKIKSNKQTNELKYAKNLYVIDIDDNQYDNINKLPFDIFKNCQWISGNTKGIHIYVKINGLTSFSNEINVLKNVKGDLLKMRNVWEGLDKHLYNSNTELPCGHQFHKECINGWVRTCPNCRKKFFGRHKTVKRFLNKSKKRNSKNKKG